MPASLQFVVDALDILLVAFVVYRLLVLVRGTRAMQIAIGLIVLFLVHQLARRFDLATLQVLLDSVLANGVLLIVVVFQNDIRRMLARVGRAPLFRGALKARDLEAIDHVVTAVEVLSQRRIGALIVFEQDAALDEFVNHGTEVGSRVSEELLYSIFVPTHENPLHDGAVIIREGRLWQAGVFLPLSGHHKLDRAFGTRHRAALGITEETDAVVVVVSEERGKVSLCFQGNLVRDVHIDELRRTLRGLFEPRRSPERVRRKATSSDSGLRHSVPPPRKERPVRGTLSTDISQPVHLPEQPSTSDLVEAALSEGDGT